jgi:hypothetical protein
MSLNNKFHMSGLVILFALISTTFVRAQSSSAFGVKAGLNVTNLKGKDATYDSRSGFHAGIFMREKFSKVAIQPEILLSTLSTDVSSTTFGDYQDKFAYLNIPIMLKFYIVDGLNIHAGPQFGFLLDGDRTYSGPFGSGSEDIKDYYKSSDISLSFGAGWDFPFGLSADIRYNLGVQDINEASSGEEVKSRVFQLSLGWNFLK